MKTIEEFINELEGSETLQNELKLIRDNDGLVAFLKKYDCSFRVEEFIKAIAVKGGEGAVADDEAESIAGGSLWLRPRKDADGKYVMEFL